MHRQLQNHTGQRWGKQQKIEGFNDIHEGCGTDLGGDTALNGVFRARRLSLCMVAMTITEIMIFCLNTNTSVYNIR